MISTSLFLKSVNANVVFSAIVFLVEQIVYHAFRERLVFSPVIASQLFQTLFHIVVGIFPVTPPGVQLAW
jgi:hypothetical protein